MKDFKTNIRQIKIVADLLADIANDLPFDANISFHYKPEGIELVIKKHNHFKYNKIIGWEEIRHSGYGLAPIKEFLSEIKVRQYIIKNKRAKL